MPEWFLVAVGLAAGLGLIYAILWACFRLETRSSKRTSPLAEPSGNWESLSIPGGD